VLVCYRVRDTSTIQTWLPNRRRDLLAVQVCPAIRCQVKLLTSAKFLTCYYFSVILLLRIKK